MTGYATLYDGLDREGPGDMQALNWALDHADLRPDAHVLDAGCGSGPDVAGLLARCPQGRVTAIDLDPEFVARARARHPGDPRLVAQLGDLGAPPPGPYDLIWSAGAVYFLGVATALTAWRNHLKPGGTVAFSQIAWRTPMPSALARAFWDEAYPEMTDLSGVKAEVTGAGYEVIACSWLSEQAWADYYHALAGRCRFLRSHARDELATILDETEAEIDIWQACGGDFGYLHVVAIPK